MTNAQKTLRDLRNRQSKERGKMAELSAAESLTDETRAELDGIEAGTPDLERQIRAATVAVETEESEQRAAGAAGATPARDAEDRERAELRGKVRLAAYLSAAVEMRAADGAEAEYLASLEMPALGRNGGTAFPLEMLAPPEQRAEHAEDRATTNVDIQTMPRTWLDRLFAETAAMRVGVNMESVPAGSASYPVTTAGASAAQRQRSTDAAADAAWDISVTELKPKRNAVRLLFSIEDAARIPGLESALTRDLRMALTEGVDRAIFLGDATATGVDADITGLNSATGITEEELTQAEKLLWPETVAAFMEMIDGLHASTPADLRIVSSVGASRLWHSTTANTNRNESVAQIMNANGLNFMSRANITEATTNDEIGAFIGRGRGIDGAAVAGIWDAGELIRDPYTGAAKGEVALTLCYLWDFGIPRAANFMRLKFVT